MTIAYDVSFLHKEKTGMGVYIYNLIKHILAIDSVNYYILFGSSLSLDVEKAKSLQAKNVSLKLYKIPGAIKRFLWNSLDLNLDSLIGNFDVFHSTEGFVLPATRKKRLVTVHSVASRIVPSLFSPSIVRDNRYLEKVAKDADAIITVSETSKGDIIKLFGVEEDRIHVHYIGRDEKFQRIADESLLADARRRFGLPQKFFLFVGTLQPAKNVGGLIDSFELFAREAGSDYKLVIVGKYGWMFDDIKVKLERLCRNRLGIHLGYVKNEDLPAIYNLSSALVLPSFYESFGIPILEAMSCGTPVICSRASAMPEIAGNAGLYVNPHDVNELAEAMRAISQDEDLYAKLSAQAFHRSNLFTWEETARKTLALYRALVD
jgi:glycosyltransferase involved in cell wall biosynthesis